ncbi:hypothetical protein PCE1_000600 [Barthelona sp. PCE]
MSTREPSAKHCRVGDVVEIPKTGKRGILRYVGPLKGQSASKIFAGVELDTPDGKNNGLYMGIEYFSCRPLYGVFVPARFVQHISTPNLEEPVTPKRPVSQPKMRRSSSKTSVDLYSKAKQLRPTDRIVRSTSPNMPPKSPGLRARSPASPQPIVVNIDEKQMKTGDIGRTMHSMVYLVNLIPDQLSELSQAFSKIVQALGIHIIHQEHTIKSTEVDKSIAVAEISGQLLQQKRESSELVALVEALSAEIVDLREFSKTIEISMRRGVENDGLVQAHLELVNKAALMGKLSSELSELVGVQTGIEMTLSDSVSKLLKRNTELENAVETLAGALGIAQERIGDLQTDLELMEMESSRLVAQTRALGETATVSTASTVLEMSETVVEDRYYPLLRSTTTLLEEVRQAGVLTADNTHLAEWLHCFKLCMHALFGKPALHSFLLEQEKSTLQTLTNAYVSATVAFFVVDHSPTGLKDEWISPTLNSCRLLLGEITEFDMVSSLPSTIVDAINNCIATFSAPEGVQLRMAVDDTVSTSGFYASSSSLLSNVHRSKADLDSFHERVFSSVEPDFFVPSFVKHAQDRFSNSLSDAYAHTEATKNVRMELEIANDELKKANERDLKMRVELEGLRVQLQKAKEYETLQRKKFQKMATKAQLLETQNKNLETQILNMSAVIDGETPSPSPLPSPSPALKEEKVSKASKKAAANVMSLFENLKQRKT